MSRVKYNTGRTCLHTLGLVTVQVHLKILPWLVDRVNVFLINKVETQE